MYESGKSLIEESPDTQKSGKLAEPIKEPILVNSKNKFEVCFVIDNSYWPDTFLSFPF